MLIPKISVIMAVYNGEKYLKLAIDSVLSQNFRDYEFIIVDDCSNDSTPAIISSYQDERIVYIRNQKNLGQTPSLNIALNIAKGNYIARIDADDIYLQGKLQKQFVFMKKHPEVAVCGTAGIKIDENGKETAVYSPPSKPSDIYFSIFYRSPLIHVSVIMVRSIILENGGYDENYAYCADFALWSKLVKNKYKITNLQDNLIKYREFSGSIGAVQKLTNSGKEMVDIIYSNITELLNIPIDREQCQDIVLMLFPSSGIGVIAICMAFLNLIMMSRKVHNNKIPMKVLVKLNSLLFWSLAKRCMYLKSQKHFGFVSKDLSNIFRNFSKYPILIAVSVISYLFVLIGENKIYRCKKLFSDAF